MTTPTKRDMPVVILCGGRARRCARKPNTGRSDTYRDYLHLNALWKQENPPWKIW